MFSRIAAVLAAAALAVTGLTVGVANATTSAALSHTAHISGNLDNGGHGYWARLDYDRTVRITKGSAEGTWDVALKDSGTFRTMPGTRSPGAGVAITRAVDGTFYGTFGFVVTSATAPTYRGVRPAYNFRCNPAVANRADCSGMPKPTSEWPALYFGEGATVTPGSWAWSYRTCSERRTDGSAGSSGDITGKRCSVEVTPVEPTVTQPACDARRGVLTIPSVRGVSYSVNNRVWRAGPHDVSPGVYWVTASVRDGYQVPRGTVLRWRLVVNRPVACPTPTPTPTPTATPKPTPSPTVTPTIPQTPVPSPSVSPAPVTPKAPTLEQPTCATEGVARITIPEVEGVTYSPEGSGTYVVKPGEVKVSAAAADGYTLADGAEMEWTFTVNEPPASCPGPAGADGKDGADGKTIVVNGVQVPSRIDTGLGGTATK